MKNKLKIQQRLEHIYLQLIDLIDDVDEANNGSCDDMMIELLQMKGVIRRYKRRIEQKSPLEQSLHRIK